MTLVMPTQARARSCSSKCTCAPIVGEARFARTESGETLAETTLAADEMEDFGERSGSQRGAGSRARSQDLADENEQLRAELERLRKAPRQAERHPAGAKRTNISRGCSVQ